MLKVTEIAFCCYAVTDFARARKFYEGALGLKPAKVNDSRPTRIGRNTTLARARFPSVPHPAGNPALTAAPWRWKWKISMRPSRICARTA